MGAIALYPAIALGSEQSSGINTIKLPDFLIPKFCNPKQGQTLMLINNLEHLEPLSSQLLQGGRNSRSQTLSLDFSNGQLSLRLGSNVLFQERIPKPETIVLSLDHASFALSSTISEFNDKFSRTVVKLSTALSDASNQFQIGRYIEWH